MAQPITDPGPMPPELAIEEAPLSDEVLARLDEAFGAADEDGAGPAQWAALFAGADPLENPDAPAAAHLIPDEARGWSITDDSAAEWAMRHVAQIDTDVQALIARRDEWARRIDGWFDHGSGLLLRRRAFFVAHLIDYGARRRAADPKAAKTLTLPSGRITSRDVKPTVKVVDDEALAAWLRERELLTAPDGTDLVEVKTKVFVVPLRKVIQPAGSGLVVVPTGEVLIGEDIPAGLDVEAGRTDYDVKPVLG